MRQTALMILTLVSLGALAACSGSSRGTGNVTVLLTDAPIDLTHVTAVNVTVTDFVLYPSDDGGEMMPLEPLSEDALTLNLLDYQNGATVHVAGGAVPAGSYNALRLYVSAAELVYDHDNDPETEDVTDPIKVPSGMVQVHVPFEVSDGEGIEITLDFDAAESVQVNMTSSDNHEYILRPVVHAVGMNPV